MMIRITKESNNENKMRTKSMDGSPLSYPPLEGNSFVVLGKALDNDPAKTRGLTTSVVQKVTKTDTGYIINTLNSTYRIEEL